MHEASTSAARQFLLDDLYKRSIDQTRGKKFIADYMFTKNSINNLKLDAELKVSGPGHFKKAIKNSLSNKLYSNRDTRAV
jgi:hypothetical protein